MGRRRQGQDRRPADGALRLHRPLQRRRERGFVTGAAGRAFAPRTNPVYLAAAPIAVFAAVFGYFAFALKGDLAAGFVDGSLPGLVRLMPTDIVAGSFAGVSLGFGFMRSFVAQER